ncbi:MAG: endonuclease/exonuclease/phosphatase family protein [Odoribacteraceae bacterium]|jgi:endonuclease/exonuclease/phosphatase family metal-dependent hydrolase|nr:endonuclease/exonuclease/phosphatase family protein [Odoribacteraceae bacterium]
MIVVDVIARLLTYLLLFGLAGSYTAPYINPNSFAFSSLFGLAYHYLVIFHLLLLVYWVIRRKKITFVLLGFLLAGYPFMTRYYGLHAKASADIPCDMEILSYNVHNLNERGLPHSPPGGKGKIEEYIRRFPGDIVCLQDFPRQERIARLFPAYTHAHAKKDVAILSRRPIIGRGSIDFDKGTTASCIYGDIIPRAGDTIRVYCVHLESFRFDGRDRQLFRDFPELQRENISKGIRSIVARLIAANKRRAKQAATIKAHASHSPYKVILCGDFNDTPLSYTYTVLKKEMHDSFIEKGRGVGNTYIGEFPSFRIDYILHDLSLSALAYSRDTLRFSDHYPIRTKFHLP